MPLTARRSVVALVLSLCALVTAAVFAPPSGTADPVRRQQPTGQPGQSKADCPNRTFPPPPVDTSEKPAPGAKSPNPVPVPVSPVGGPRMGECGLVLPQDASQPPEINADSWLLADLDSGVVLAAKDPHGRHRPASLMKVLLAMVAARDLRPDTMVAATRDDATQEGSKVGQFGIGAGGTYTVRQLMYGLLLESGNDAAHALARQLGGIPTALRKMNELARELGALDTRAATPSGLDGPGMSASAYDMAVIFRAAMKYPEFAQPVATKQIEFPGYGNKPKTTIVNDNKLLTSYKGAIGGKSGGFTDDALQTYIGAAERDSRRLVAVLMRAEQKPPPIWLQAGKLLDYGFAMKTGNQRPVGQLVDRAPDEQAVFGARPTPISVGDHRREGSGAHSQMSAAFGNVGGPLTAVAGVFLLVAVVLWWRKRRAKLARAAAAMANRPRPGPGPSATLVDG